MRIIPNGIEPHIHTIEDVGDYPHFDVADTIEITEDEWAEIGRGFICENDDCDIDLFDYLRKLVELARVK